MPERGGPVGTCKDLAFTLSDREDYGGFEERSYMCYILFYFLKIPTLSYFFPLSLFYFILVVTYGLWDLSSPTRDRTCTSFSESVESYQLDHLGSPNSLKFENDQSGSVLRIESRS